MDPCVWSINESDAVKWTRKCILHLWQKRAQKHRSILIKIMCKKKKLMNEWNGRQSERTNTRVRLPRSPRHSSFLSVIMILQPVSWSTLVFYICQLRKKNLSWNQNEKSLIRNKYTIKSNGDYLKKKYISSKKVRSLLIFTINNHGISFLNKGNSTQNDTFYLFRLNNQKRVKIFGAGSASKKDISKHRRVAPFTLTLLATWPLNRCATCKVLSYTKNE